MVGYRFGALDEPTESDQYASFNGVVPETASNSSNARSILVSASNVAAFAAMGGVSEKIIAVKSEVVTVIGWIFIGPPGFSKLWHQSIPRGSWDQWIFQALHNSGCRCGLNPPASRSARAM